MRKYNCKMMGCFAVLDKPGQYCAKHKQMGAEQEARKLQDRRDRKPYAGAQRPNSGLYNTAAWRNLRAGVLAEQGACVRCGSTDRLQVHHIVPPKGDAEAFYDRDNLAVLCFACHLQVTRAEVPARR